LTPLKSSKSASSGSGPPAFAVSRRFSISACRFAPKLSVERVGREVGTVGPAHRAELIDRDLPEKLRITRQRLENGAKKPLGEVQLAGGFVVKTDFDPEAGQGFNGSNAAHTISYS